MGKGFSCEAEIGFSCRQVNREATNVVVVFFFLGGLVCAYIALQKQLSQPCAIFDRLNLSRDTVFVHFVKGRDLFPWDKKFAEKGVVGGMVHLFN